MTKRDYAIAKLLEEAIDARDAEALCALWRRFAKWHGMNPDFAVVLQEQQGFDAAGLDAAGRILARMLESKSIH